MLPVFQTICQLWQNQTCNCQEATCNDMIRSCSFGTRIAYAPLDADLRTKKDDKIMGHLSSLLAGSTALALCVSSASADSSGPIVTSTPIPTTSTDFTGTLAFPQFDPSLGALDSVTLAFSSTLSTSFSIANNSATLSSAGKATTALMVSVEDANGDFLAGDPQLDIPTLKFQFKLAPDASTNNTQSVTGNSSDLTYTSAAILDEFTGDGDIDLTANTLTDSSLSLSGSETSFNQVTAASLTGTVTYGYAPDPVPDQVPTLGLLIVGLATLPLVRHRFERK